MTDADANIRESLLTTISFLASESQQLQFAAEVPYEVYQDEFGCWWFDTFYPEESNALSMLKPEELSVLIAFSTIFELNLKTIAGEPLSIMQLLSKPEWQAITAAAEETTSKLRIVA